MSTVGVIVNPVAGKDIRRLVTSASHTSDSAKIGIDLNIAGAKVLELIVSDGGNGLSADHADLADAILWP